MIGLFVREVSFFKGVIETTSHPSGMAGLRTVATADLDENPPAGSKVLSQVDIPPNQNGTIFQLSRERSAPLRFSFKNKSPPVRRFARDRAPAWRPRVARISVIIPVLRVSSISYPNGS
jgi:hypothetical protein